MFVTFEGLDGSGKTTQLELLRRHLAGSGREVVATREPGGTDVGEKIRELLLRGGEMTAWTEAALFAAARAEHVERVIRPALGRGAAVLCDRYIDSSVAYQGGGRGLGLDGVLALSLQATDSLLPDLTILLLLDPAEAAARIGSDPDRIEREHDDFRERVDQAYRELARRFPERIVALDGKLPPERIAEVVRERVDSLS
jgi:dTMP kinase